jgi:hypothetical protein
MPTTRSEKLSALKEASIDTGLATILNFPLNFVLVSLAFYLELTALQTSIMFTIIFSTVAIIRKTWVRLYFYKKSKKFKRNTNAVY